MAGIFDEVDAMVVTKIQASELRMRKTLEATAENYRRELNANIEYHRHLAKTASEIKDSSAALRHNLLAEIYQSLLDRA